MQKPSPLLTEYDWHIQSWQSWSTCRREAANFCVWKSTTWRHIPWDICEAMDAVTEVFEAKIGTSDFRLRWPFCDLNITSFWKQKSIAIICKFCWRTIFLNNYHFFFCATEVKEISGLNNKNLVKTTYCSDLELPFIASTVGFLQKIDPPPTPQPSRKGHLVDGNSTLLTCDRLGQGGYRNQASQKLTRDVLFGSWWSLDFIFSPPL